MFQCAGRERVCECECVPTWVNRGYGNTELWRRVINTVWIFPSVGSIKSCKTLLIRKLPHRMICVSEPTAKCHGWSVCGTGVDSQLCWRQMGLNFCMQTLFLKKSRQPPLSTWASVEFHLSPCGYRSDSKNSCSGESVLARRNGYDGGYRDMTSLRRFGGVSLQNAAMKHVPLFITNYLRIENAEGYVLIAVYLFIYLYACYSHN